MVRVAQAFAFRSELTSWVHVSLPFAALLMVSLPGCDRSSAPTQSPDSELPDDRIEPGTTIGSGGPGTPLGAARLQPFEEIGQLVAEGKYDEALKRSDAELAKQPKAAAPIHFVRAMALARLQRHDEAIAAWERAYELDPTKMYGALDAIGTVYVERGDLDRAIEYYQRAVKARDDFADAHFNLGMALAQKGDADGAYTELTRAVTLDPENANTWLQLAVLDQARGDMAAARKKVDEAVAADPKHAFARMVHGDVLVDAGEIDAGVAEYEQAVTLEPTLGDARMRLIRALRKAGREAEATKHADELVRLSPQSAVAWSIHSQIAFDRGEHAQALREIDKALALNPRLESAHRRKIRFLVAAKRCDEARKALKAFEANGAERGAASQATAEVRACRG